MSNLINPTDEYKELRNQPYCFRPQSSRRVNSVKELNRLLTHIAKLEMNDNKPLLAKIDDLARIIRLRENELKRAFERIAELLAWKEYHEEISRNRVDLETRLRERIAELEEQVEILTRRLSGDFVEVDVEDLGND